MQMTRFGYVSCSLVRFTKYLGEPIFEVKKHADPIDNHPFLVWVKNRGGGVGDGIVAGQGEGAQDQALGGEVGDGRHGSDP
jgi:hypothetical protein